MRWRENFRGIRLCIVAIGLMAGCSQTGPERVADVQGVKNLSRDGDIYIAGTPTPEGLEGLKQRGVKTVIDLRQPKEGTADEEAAARALGLRYINIPMESDKLTDAQASAVLEAMEQAGGEPVLMHCSGGNRAGAAYGLYLGKTGKCPTAEAIDRARAAGMKNPKIESDMTRELKKPAGE
ncbi:MAG: protein tyrosine phosphatase family protein [Planctomycetia bacterium]|nr:protein tyrosine phosphatase family protein [Planctomycetia bacterium]MCC7313925.1 protein tyrosine phosphatase family protein [Planctomycetota bacterium]OQZ06178.1 MAG: hypothetical protein B6D36_06350 [Planctomycetes bacterium UTPLA1]